MDGKKQITGVKTGVNPEKINSTGVELKDTPAGMDRRAFLMRSAILGSAAVIAGQPVQRAMAKTGEQSQAEKVSNLTGGDQLMAMEEKGPVLTTVEEMYKTGPGPSSSHTIGPMRITYDFYKRAIKLPPEELAKVTDIRIELFGSLSATGQGHGTHRAALAGLLGKEPATVDPAFLDSLAADPDKAYPLKLGDKTFEISSTKNVVYGPVKGDFPHANTMTCALLNGDQVVYSLEYYSIGGGFFKWKGYEPPKKGEPTYPYATMANLLEHVKKTGMTIPQIAMANEVSVSGKAEVEINQFLDSIIDAMIATVDAGLNAEPGVLPGPIKLKTKADEVFKRAMQDEYKPQQAIGLVSAYALAASEENARGHLVITAPTCGSAGVMPSLVYAMEKGLGNVPREKVREGMLSAAVIGYLCKHHATLAAAEGGCQAEIGVASSMGAALCSSALGHEAQVVANAAESALEHSLGLTCDPVAGYVQIPCIERCAFGAVRAWTGMLIAKNEVFSDHRVDFDATLRAMAMTAKDMNSKYKETSEAGLAVSLVLC